MTVLEMVNVGDPSDVVRIKYKSTKEVVVYAVVGGVEQIMEEHRNLDRVMAALRDYGYKSVRKYHE